MTAVCGIPSTARACTVELDEAELHRCVEQRYGPVKDEHRNKLDGHLANLETLVRAASGHGPARWNEADRRRLGYRPSEVLAAVREDAACLCPEEYEASCLRRLQAAMSDPLLSGRGRADALATGDSQCRPRSLYADDSVP